MQWDCGNKYFTNCEAFEYCGSGDHRSVRIDEESAVNSLQFGT